jgi:hypothetical protein
VSRRDSVKRNRGADSVGIFAPGAEDSVINVPVGVRPNGLDFDARRGILLAANVGDPALPGLFTLSMVDVAQRRMRHSIPVPGRTRWAIYDARLDRFFVNIADPAQIVTVAGDASDSFTQTSPRNWFLSSWLQQVTPPVTGQASLADKRR